MVNERFEEWAILEVMGYTRYIGYVSEVTIAGAAMIRIDVLEVAAERGLPAIPAYTKFVGTGVVYSITPCSEEFAKVAARRIRALPHNMYIPELFMPEEDIQIEHDRDETASSLIPARNE